MAKKKKPPQSSGTSLFGSTERILETRPISKAKRGRKKPGDEEVVLVTRTDRAGKRIGRGRVVVREV